MWRWHEPCDAPPVRFGAMGFRRKTYSRERIYNIKYMQNNIVVNVIIFDVWFSFYIVFVVI